ncbi:outer membrane protein assembly factor BamB family protein [Wenjunlia tyrosinilytica]|nr:PQQ-binding-like beta-propeller repeat protein [Wenjunlia tyrosinilytica]
MSRNQQPGYGYPQVPPPALPAQPVQPQWNPYAQPPPSSPRAQQPHPQGQQPLPPPPQQPWAGGYNPYAGDPQAQPYPQQPGSPVPGTPAPRGRRRGVILGVVAGVVALALTGVGTVYFMSGDGDGDGGKGRKKEAARPDGRRLTAAGKFDVAADRSALWKTESGPTHGPQNRTSLIGEWVGRRSVVVGDVSRLVSYDMRTGRRQWELKPPVSGAKPCEMSDNATSEGLGAVLYRPDGSSTTSPCTLLVVADMRTGRVKWSHDVAPDTDTGFSDPSVAVDAKRNRVYAATAHMLFSYGLNKGKRYWKVGGSKFCPLEGKAAPSAVVVAEQCDKGTTIFGLDLGERDKAKAAWKYRVEGGPGAEATVVSARPAVAMVNPGSAAARGGIMRIDSKGRPGTRIPVAQPFGKLPEADSSFNSLPNYTFDGSTMIATVGLALTQGRSHTVAAFDLSTGKEKWHRKIAPEGQSLQVVGVRSGAVVAAVGSRDTSARSRFYRIPIDSGTPVKGGRFPGGTAVSPEYYRVVVRGNLALSIAVTTLEGRPRVTAFAPTS